MQWEIRGKPDALRMPSPGTWVLGRGLMERKNGTGPFLRAFMSNTALHLAFIHDTVEEGRS